MIEPTSKSLQQQQQQRRGRRQKRSRRLGVLKETLQQTRWRRGWCFCFACSGGFAAAITSLLQANFISIGQSVASRQGFSSSSRTANRTSALQFHALLYIEKKKTKPVRLPVLRCLLSLPWAGADPVGHIKHSLPSAGMCLRSGDEIPASTALGAGTVIVMICAVH